jgi:hypothetical protein
MPASSSTSANDGECRGPSGCGTIRIDPDHLEALDHVACILRSNVHEGTSVPGVRRASLVSDLAEPARLEPVRFSPEADTFRYGVARYTLDEVSGERLRHRSPVGTGPVSRPAGRQRAYFPGRVAADGEDRRV